MPGIQFLLCLVLALQPNSGFGQQAIVDSLLVLLEEKDLELDKKLEIYDALVYSHWEHDAQKGIPYGHKGIALAKKHKNKKWLSTLYSHTAMGFYMLTQYDSAHYYQDLAFEPSAGLEDLTPLANAHMNKGSIYKMQSKHPEALKEYFEALRLFEEQGHQKGKGMVLQNISIVYILLRNHDQALKYLKEAETIALEINDMENLGTVLISLTNIYRETDVPKAIDHAKRALEIYREMDNKYALAITLSVLGRCYLADGNYELAARNTEQGLELAKEVGYPNLLGQLYVNLANIRFAQGRYAESQELSLKAQQQDTANIDLRHNVLLNQIRNNMYMGQLKKAEHFIDEYYESVQQFASKEYQSTLSQMEAKYETEKKEMQIGALKKQSTLYMWLGITGALILLIALAYAFLRYRLAVNKRRLAEKEAQRMEQEQHLVAVQATLDGETAERTRLAKDLHDGLGSMLSLVKFNLPQVKGDAVLEEMDVSRFRKALDMLDDSIQELRRVAHHMMPETLLRHGLKVSLSDFCAAIPNADFHYFGNGARLPGKMEVMVYRCIHELVNNTLKHAQAGKINVQLVQEDHRVSFTVQDDGRGFDPQATHEGMGLRNIRQRVAAFMGKMEIYSTGEGTETHVELELDENGQYD